MTARLTVRVRAGARAAGIVRSGDAVVVAVRERAQDGRANSAVVRAVAAWLDVAPSRITIERGAVARVKRLALADVSDAGLAEALERLASEPFPSSRGRDDRSG
jgi:uncharacterized protein